MVESTEADSKASALSQGQQTALRALVDALLPSLQVPTSDESVQPHPSAKRYWEHRVASDESFFTVLETCIDEKLSSEDRTILKTFLSVISTAIGTSVVFGRPTLHCFAEWSALEKTELLTSLQMSSLEVRRQLFANIKRLVCGIAYTYTDDTGTNPFWEFMGYPGPPAKSKDDAARVAKAARHQQGIPKAIQTVDPFNSLIECDIVIVGSGAGGGVAAKVMQQAGYDVVVLEQGSYVSPEDTSNLEADAMDRM
jgi:long-chain-alcohol oxidase